MKAVKINNEQEYHSLMEAYDKVGWNPEEIPSYKEYGGYSYAEFLLKTLNYSKRRIIFGDEYLFIYPSVVCEEISVEQALEILEGEYVERTVNPYNEYIPSRKTRYAKVLKLYEEQTYTLRQLLNKIQVIDEETGEEGELVLANSFGRKVLSAFVNHTHSDVYNKKLKFKIK